MKRPTQTISRRHQIALLLRVAPLGVLMIAMLAFACWVPNASAQNFQNGFGQTPNYNAAPFQTQNQFGQPPRAAAAPAARVAAQPGNPAAGNRGLAGGIPPLPGDQTAASPPGDVQTESETPWQMPAIVGRLAQGGWLMFPLGLCSLVVVALSMERLIALRRSRVIPRPFVRRFTECVEDGQLSYDEATSICEEFDCPVAEVFRAAVRRWGRPMMEIEQAVMDAGDRVSDSLRRFVRVFHAISNVAPLLGLLGTVLGMIEAFETMGQAESIGRPDMLASGISVALITTAAGLSVAIPAYLAYMYFSAKSDRYLGEIDKLCTKVVDSISAEALESESKSRPRKRAA